MAALQEAAFTGLNGGMNLSRPAYELEDNECRYLQDALLDYQGLVRRRGPVQPSDGFVAFTEKGSGIAGTIDPAGNYRLLVLTGDASNGYFRLLDPEFDAMETWASPLTMPASPPSDPYRITDIKPGITGGVLAGIAAKYTTIGATSYNDAILAFWGGGYRNAYIETGTITMTRGSAAVTGSGTTWTTEVSPGMYLFANIPTGDSGPVFKGFIGQVKSVEGNTALTLTAPSPYTASGTVGDFQPVRGWNYRVSKGRITTTTSGTTVTGATTKFISQFMDEVLNTQNGTTTNASAVITGLSSTAGLLRGMRITGTNIPAAAVINSVDSGTQITISANATGSGSVALTFKYGWNLYRASDMGWIGRVSVINNEISITLAANAAIALNNERFIALKSGFGQYTTTNPDVGIIGNNSSLTSIDRHKVGFITASYAGRQWYANNPTKLERTSRIWFSEIGDPEAVDLSEYDGDFINAYSSVETDTPIKALVPAYNGLVVIKENETFAVTGSTPTTFSLKKIYDDGTLSGMSAASYAGGVIWAGREGILFYDGIQTQNVTQDRLGDYYKNAIRLINPNTHRMWASVVREHYFLFIESYDPSVAVVKGAVSSTPRAVTIVINMVNGAINFWTNVAFRGSIETPADVGAQTLMVMNDANIANIVNASSLFDETGRDSFLCDGVGYSLENFGPTDNVNVSTSSHQIDDADTKWFQQVTPNGVGQIESVTARMWVQTDGTATNFKAGVYADSAGAPGALLGTSNEVTLDGADSNEGTLHTFDFATVIPVDVDTPVWIGLIRDGGTCVTHIGKIGTEAGVVKVAADTYAGGFEDPFGTIDSTLDGQMAMYATMRIAGPDFFLESKKYTMGNPMVKKLFKQLSLTYMCQGDALKLDTVLGNQFIGRTARSEFPATVYTWGQLGLLITTWVNTALQFPTWDALVAANFRPRRIKFLKRSQMLSFRLYQKSQAVTQLQLGPFQLAFKWQRIGRI